MPSYNLTVHELHIGFEKAHDSVQRKVVYNFVTELGISKVLVRLIKICLNKTYNKVCIDKSLSQAFLVQNGLKQGNALSSVLFNLLQNMPSRRSKKIKKDWN
jgi:hypothetical protein